MTIPKRTHPFKTGDGTPREYEWVTDAACHVCNPYGVDPDRVLGVVSDIEGTLTTECLNCAHEERHRSDTFQRKFPRPAEEEKKA